MQCAELPACGLLLLLPACASAPASGMACLGRPLLFLLPPALMPYLLCLLLLLLLRMVASLLLLLLLLTPSNSVRFI
jgi:hypothetical protein